MTPSNYANMLNDSSASKEILYWLEELLTADVSRNFESDSAQSMNAGIDIYEHSGLLHTDKWSIACEKGLNDRITFRHSYSGQNAYSLAASNVLSCINTQSARTQDDVMLGIQGIFCALRIKDAIQPKDFSEKMTVAQFIYDLEPHVIDHLKACETYINTGNGQADIDKIEARMIGLIASNKDLKKINPDNPISLDFNRDARGPTVIFKSLSEDIRVSVNKFRTGSRATKTADKEIQNSPIAVIDVPQSKKSDPKPAAVKSTAAKEIKSVAIDEDMLEILRKGAWKEGTSSVFALPEGQLDREVYEKLSWSVKLAGGKWSTAKQGFIFKDGPDKLNILLETGKAVDRKQYDFFWTPKEFAERLVRESGLQPGMLVLEPSAGDGAIADAAAEIVGKNKVICYEILPENVAKLRAKGYAVFEGDFLESNPSPIFDRVLMNPPFGNQADMRHVEHASKWMNKDGFLCAIVSTSYTSRRSDVADKFRDFMETAGSVVENIEAGVFKDSGTNVSTVMISIDSKLLNDNQIEDESNRSIRESSRA